MSHDRSRPPRADEVDPNDVSRSGEEFGDPVEDSGCRSWITSANRRRLIIAIVATLVGMLGCFGFVEHIWDFLVSPMNEALESTARHDGDHGATEGFMTLKVAGVAGVGFASPVIIGSSEVRRPRAVPQGKALIVPLVFSSTILFLGGAAFCYLVIFQFAFPFFIEVNPEGVAVLSMQSYLSVATRLLLAFGVSFQPPVVVFPRAG